MPTNVSHACAPPGRPLQLPAGETTAKRCVKGKPTPSQRSVEFQPSSSELELVLKHHAFNGVTCLPPLEHHLHHIHLLRLKAGNCAILKRLPLSSKPILRLERDVVENEIAVNTLARAMRLPVPKVIACNDRFTTSCKPFLATKLTEGISYGKLVERLTDCQKSSIKRQVASFANTLRGHRSSRFGSVADVAKGEGCRTWAGTFGRMFEAILMDGEDMLVGLPYIHLREQLGRLRTELNQVVEATLVLPGLWDPKNILVDPNKVTVSGVLDLGWMALWGDLDFMGPRDATKPKSLLYACFHAVLVIVRHHYRPRDWQSRSELDAWKDLNQSLTSLMRMDH